MNRNSCPDFETLSAYVDHELSGRELEAISNHVAECAYCRRQHDRLVQLSNEFSTMQAESIDINIIPEIQERLNAKPGLRRRPGNWLNGRFISYGLAASFALVVGINLGNHIVVDDVKVDLTFTQAAQMAPFSFIPPGSINLEHATCFIGKRI
ncbi:anti-sigma factor family protein [Sedimenticola sp.]|uniref:anti-sigma factor family protein n=1 Tax=Sedimenticola sp. TaxID=1940285 RepID=UPI00258B7D6A|nr:zf-HC2 domain-containing protein [Sedimenticola sp.]MCW8903965.1 zf-HC2 domain-containing protein [Sedimenticola sp.]